MRFQENNLWREAQVLRADSPGVLQGVPPVGPQEVRRVALMEAVVGLGCVLLGAGLVEQVLMLDVNHLKK